MQIKRRKLIAFFTTWLTLLFIAILTILFVPESWIKIGRLILIGILGNAIGFISFSVIKDYIRSKYYRKELDDDKN
jgi:hypothetical protein